MVHLVQLRLSSEIPPSGFPYSLPLLQNFKTLRLTKPVTFFVGENGSGKSTFLEAIAAKSYLPAVGADEVDYDASLSNARKLAEHLILAWSKRTHKGFFLRAEDFFRWQHRMNQTMQELEAQAQGYLKELEDNPRDEGLMRALGSVRGQKRAISSRYGEDVDARSHGEAFLNLFENRLVPGGLYLLDEPETPLSPLRQLTLLKLMKEFVPQGCQFIIATHSPILMAYPDAEILDFNSCPVSPIDYDEVEHVSLTRAFLANPEAFLRRL